MHSGIETFFKEKKFKLSYLLLILVIILLFIISIVFSNNANQYTDVQTFYTGYLMSKLLWNTAWFFVAVLAWSKLRVIFQAKIEVVEQKYFMVFFLIVAVGILVFSTIALAEDLIAKSPSQIEGVVVTKEQRPLVKEGFKNVIRLDTTPEELTVEGDIEKIGFNLVKKGDIVKIWYGKNTKIVFLIKKVIDQ